MTELEKQITELLEEKIEKKGVIKTMSMVKKTLDSSSILVDSINELGDTLKDNINNSVKGKSGTVSGWIAGKSIKIVGGLGAGVIAGTLKTVAGIIPDSSDPKNKELDTRISQLIKQYPIPLQKESLLELLQYLWSHISLDNPFFGKMTLEAMKGVHENVYETLKNITEKNDPILKLAKSYIPKKKFGLI